uniref:Uncharacterized protein n=1 Tax=Anguilla anguilla TaxID=7936 RepID=A0A0E9UGZ2_ANGAN
MVFLDLTISVSRIQAFKSIYTLPPQLVFRTVRWKTGCFQMPPCSMVFPRG